jgi:hypothetical protein
MIVTLLCVRRIPIGFVSKQMDGFTSYNGIHSKTCLTSNENIVRAAGKITSLRFEQSPTAEINDNS